MIEYSQQQDVAVLTIDDGKANAVGHAFIDAMNRALDRAEKEAKAVLVTGRAGVFSGGFDLKEFQKGADATMALVNKGAHLLLRVFSHPNPWWLHAAAMRWQRARFFCWPRIRASVPPAPSRSDSMKPPSA